MEKTSYHSYKLNKLGKGCELCIRGRKSVLFITGICPECCFYCPISEQKSQKDVIYINEWPTRKWKNIVEEIKLCDSYGVGITGGDPLARLDRTLLFIKKLKEQFGKRFHIHLYTPLTLVNENALSKLYKAGLDEIRFHPGLEHPDKESWKKIVSAKKFNWKVGVEIPVIPKKEVLTEELVNFLIEIKMDFLNLNELEYSDTNANKLAEHGYRTRNELTYAIKGSQEMALKLLRHIEKKAPKMNVHYCTARLKDSVQMKKRIELRASHIKQPFDLQTKAGTLIRGAVYLNDLFPTAGYRKALAQMSEKRRRNLTKNLINLKKSIEKEFKLKEIIVDKNKLRLVTSMATVQFLADNVSTKLFRLAIVEEYPTHDALEVEINFL